MPRNMDCESGGEGRTTYATPMLVAKDRQTGMVFALLVERNGAADPHAVEKLDEWVDMLGHRWPRAAMEPAVMQVTVTTLEDICKPGRITLEPGLAGSAGDWWVAWTRYSRMTLSSTARCRYHQNRRQLHGKLGTRHVAEPGHGWLRWEGTIRTVTRSRTPRGQMHVRGTSVVSSGSTERSNKGRRQDGIWHIRWLPAEASTFWLRKAKRWRSDHPEETSVKKVGQPEKIWPWNRPWHWQDAAVRHMWERRGRNHEFDEAPLPKPLGEIGPSKRVPETIRLRRTQLDPRVPWRRAMREGTRAQGHSAVCRARMEELTQRNSEGPTTFGRGWTPHTGHGPPNESSSSSPPDQQIPWAPAVQVAATPLQGVMLQVLAMSLQGVSLKMLATLSQGCRSRCSSRHCNVGRGWQAQNHPTWDRRWRGTSETTAHGEEDRTGDGSVKFGEGQGQPPNPGLVTWRLGTGDINHRDAAMFCSCELRPG